MTNNTLKFWDMLKIFKVSKLFYCKEFIISLFIPTVLFYSLFFIDSHDLKKLVQEISTIFIGVDAAIIAIVIAGFAILFSVTDTNFLYFLKQKDLHVRFFFPFYLSSILWGGHIIFSIVLLVLAKTNIQHECFNLVLIILFWISIFGFIYSLLNSISLVGTILRLGFKKVEFHEILGTLEKELEK